MKNGVKGFVAAASLLGIVSSYAVCYSNVQQNCAIVGSTWSYHTYFPGDPCYNGGTYYPPMTVVWSAQPFKCVTYRGGLDVPYDRVYRANSCWFDTKWTDCFGFDHYDSFAIGYYECTSQCTP